MARLTAVGGYGLCKLSSSHCVGERADDETGSKLKEAKMSSNSDIVEDVTEVTAASAFTRQWEIASSREMTNFGYSAWSSCPQAIRESRSSWITTGFANGMAGGWTEQCGIFKAPDCRGDDRRG